MDKIDPTLMSYLKGPYGAASLPSLNDVNKMQLALPGYGTHAFFIFWEHFFENFQKKKSIIFGPKLDYNRSFLSIFDHFGLFLDHFGQNWTIFDPF